MSKSQHHAEELEPHGQRDRGAVNDGPQKGQNARPAKSHDPDNARLEADKNFRPDRDGSGQ